MSVVLSFDKVTVRRDGQKIIDRLDWSVRADERWAIIGPNGAGKTTLLTLAGALIHPSSGTVTVLGDQLGKADVFDIRPRVGLASSRLAQQIPPEETVLNVVLTAAYAVTGRWKEAYEHIDERRALRVLKQWQLSELADRTYRTLSDGERKRTEIARAVMTDPELLLLDEATASLDLGAREELIQLLSAYAKEPTTPAMVIVTHHVEEIPPEFTHILLMRDGQVVASGPIATTLTEQNLSTAFNLPVHLSEQDGRYAARAVVSL